MGSDHIHRVLAALLCTSFLVGCVQAVPPDLVAAVEAIDQDLIALRAPETAPEEYRQFVRQWALLKARAQLDDDVIRWPWESSDLESDLRWLYVMGERTVSQLHDRQVSQQTVMQAKVTRLEEQIRNIAARVEAIDGRILLGEKGVQAGLLVKQARSFLDQKDYTRAMQIAEKADHALKAQASLLNQELGRYADDSRITYWQTLAKQTIDWSRLHQATAIVVSKAERELSLYQSGRKVVSYSVRLGFNGMLEKQFQGDGATPEGRYHVTDRRGRGQTQFYRALALDYPNGEDRRRFQHAKRSGKIAQSKAIGGQIEIHGADNERLAQTLGCIMLDNPNMAALYERVPVGTPVTIVGALTKQNAVAAALAQLDRGKEEI
ncbi:MAG: L,D-transpeptidase [Nitrospira sp.]|nr:L,D-transpeptidase [Nitrospira sp.]MDH4305160.1 L,D-transpeptidase [Nitrospira sp.]MDH5194959.1 L,D-transpeptidase [Nitrospira sp.]